MIFDLIYIVMIIWMAFGLAYTNSWHWKERDSSAHSDKMKANTKWHRWQYWGVLVPTFLTFLGMTFFSVSPYAILLSVPIWWIMFDGTIAKLLGKPWWYVGETATIDKLIKSPIPKLVFVFVALVLYILDKVSVL